MEQQGAHRKALSDEQRLLDTFEQAAVGIAQVSPEGKWLRLNRKYCEILGYSQEELMSLTFQEITHSDELDANLNVNEQLMAGDIDHYTMEKRYIRKDGSHVWVNLTVSLVRDEHQQPLYSIAVVEDITAKKQAEEALRRSLKREHFASEIIDGIRSEMDLETILNKAVNGIGNLANADRCIIWLYDSKTKQFQFPNSNQEYYSGPEVEPLFATIQEIPNVEQLETFGLPIFPYIEYAKVANIRDVYAIKGLTELDYTVFQARGIKSLLHVPIIYNEQFLGLIRLHSVLKQREWDEEIVSLVELIAARLAVAIYHAKLLQELKDSEARKSGILESSLDAIITIDASGKLIEWNASAERILGYKREDVLGQDLAKLIIPTRYQKAHYEGLAHYLATGEGAILNKTLELPACRADGSEFSCELSITQVPISEESIFTGVLRDITERKKVEQDLQIYAAKLEESNKDLEHFAAVASHDLQAPLRKIQMFSSYLEQASAGELTAEGKDYITRIHKSIANMQRLIDDLLDFSRVNRRGKPFSRTDLQALTKEIVLDLQPLLNETNGRIEVGDMVTAEVDATQMQSLIFNLISNGLKFQKKGTSPIVRLSAFPIDAEYYELVVSDNGIGIKEEHFQRIFDIFSRLHSTDIYPGTGIGLALCKKIAERHGGNITVTSKLNVGSTFRVRLPFAPTKSHTFEEIIKVDISK